MNKENSAIRDIIIPLDRYPHMTENGTIQEAIETLMAFRAKEKGELLYTLLLVVNDKNQLVGKLSLVDILHGLVPRLVDATKNDTFEGKDTEYQNLAFFYEEKTFAKCGENQRKPIKPLLQAIDFSISAETHVLNALVMMSHRNDFYAPVTENGNIIGILRLEEIFNAMCNTYCSI